ncbi:MAG: hypothetical protein JJV98_14950 [Desulfosarcina sp.]|nr:hypothetical protein [Desulfobacterales bacterium]
MSQLDYIAIALLGTAALVAVGSFAVIANYLFTNELADRREPFPNIIALYKKYRDHTRARTGRVDPWLWIHMAAAGLFILAGMVYAILRFI